jgi:hypothetical protein
MITAIWEPQILETEIKKIIIMKMKELAKAFSKFSNAEQESLHRLFIQVFFYFIYLGISCPKFIITVCVINY